MQAAEGEAVAEHEGDEVVVDVVGEHLLVALDDVVEYLEVHLALREAAARVDGHGLVEDALGDLAVAAVYAAVVDVEGVAAVALDDLYVGPFAEEAPEGAAHVLQRAFDLAAFAGVGGGGLGDVAMRYGFQRFRPDIMAYTVIILIVMVQIIQSSGNFLYKITKK